MRPTRREFIKGAVITTAAVTSTGSEGFQLKKTFLKKKTREDRCPYFDQPRYCKDKSPDRPLCDGR